MYKDPKLHIYPSRGSITRITDSSTLVREGRWETGVNLGTQITMEETQVHMNSK